jgi:hypothetical protein
MIAHGDPRDCLSLFNYERMGPMGSAFRHLGGLDLPGYPRCFLAAPANSMKYPSESR